jgi:hypothetical protein
MDNLSSNAILACQAGMSYGQWKALHPKTKDDIEVYKPGVGRKCANCGGLFYFGNKKRKFCGDPCANAYNCKKRRERIKLKNAEIESNA